MVQRNYNKHDEEDLQRNINKTKTISEDGKNVWKANPEVALLLQTEGQKMLRMSDRELKQ